LVEQQIDSGLDFIAQLKQDGFDVSVAFWVKTLEEGLWFLYIGSNSAQPGDMGEVYRRVYATLSRIGDKGISLSDIKVIPANNPIATDAMVVRDRYSGNVPTRYHGKRLGLLAIEAAYIYPSESASLTVNAVTNVDLKDGGLRVWKVAVSMPKKGPPPKPAEWVSDVKLLGDRLTVEKVKIIQGPNGLEAKYSEEVQAPVSKITGIQASP